MGIPLIKTSTMHRTSSLALLADRRTRGAQGPKAGLSSSSSTQLLSLPQQSNEHDGAWTTTGESCSNRVPLFSNA